MAITVTERPDSRRWSGGVSPICEFRYRISGTASDTATMAALLAAAPESYEDLVRDLHPSLEPVEATVDETTARGLWDATVPYVRPDRRTAPASTIGTVRVKWHTGGGTQHTIACIETLSAYGAPGVTPDVSDTGDLIRYNSETKTSEGLDIACPIFAFTVSKVFAVGELPSPGYLFWATATTNDAPWTVTDTVTGQTYTFDTGEVLFKGVEMNEVRSDGGVELVFEFEAAPNRDDIEVGLITGIAKRGMQWLEVKYRPKPVFDIGGLMGEPMAAYVMSLYYSTDYASLGI
jgi:hypothetical protein